LRDERKHAEEQEREAAQRKKESSQSRLQALRKREHSAPGESYSTDDDEATRSGHVNLFALEEEENRKRAEKATSTINSVGEEKRKNAGIMPLYLGQSASKESFYLQAGCLAPQDQELTAKESRLKRRMDPMKEFVRTEGDTKQFKEESKARKPDPPRTKHRRRNSSKYESSSDSSSSESESTSSTSSCSDDSSRRHRRRHKRRKSSSLSRKRRRKDKKTRKDETSQTSLEELRQRRAQRESRERERQNSLIASSGGNQRYQDQYNPKLSRN